MLSDLSKQLIQCARLDWTMLRHDNMMLAVLFCDQMNVTAALPNESISESIQRSDKLSPGDIPREFHAAITSSRTK